MRDIPGHPSLRKACGVLVRDALFLSLLGDSNGRGMAEERMIEVMASILPAHTGGIGASPALTEFVNEHLRVENRELKEKLEVADEKNAFLGRQLQSAQAEAQKAQLDQLVRSTEEDRVQTLVRETREEAARAAKDVSALQRKLQLAEQAQFQAEERLRQQSHTVSDARLLEGISGLKDALAFEVIFPCILGSEHLRPKAIN